MSMVVDKGEWIVSICAKEVDDGIAYMEIDVDMFFESKDDFNPSFVIREFIQIIERKDSYSLPLHKSPKFLKFVNGVEYYACRLDNYLNPDSYLDIDIMIKHSTAYMIYETKIPAL